MTRTTRALGQVSLRLLHLAGRPGGVTVAEAQREAGLICSNWSAALRALYESKHVVRRKDGPHWRYFIGNEAALAWELAQMEPQPEPEPEAPWECFRPAETFAQEWARLRGEGAGE